MPAHFRRSLWKRLALAAAALVVVVLVAGLVGGWFDSDDGGSSSDEAGGSGSGRGRTPSEANPDNDDFEAPADIVDTTFSGTTEQAGTQDAEVAAGLAFDGERTVWFTWSPPTTGAATFTPEGEGASPEVRAFVGDSLEALESALLPDEGQVVVAAVAGTTYRIAIVDHGDGAPFTFVINQFDTGLPANDEAAGAIEISPTEDAAATDVPVAVAQTLGATPGAADPEIGGAPATRSVWYSFTAPTSGTLDIAAEPAAPGVTGPEPVRVGVFTLDPDALPVPVAQDPDGLLELYVDSAVPYLLAVDGPEGWIALRVALVAPPATDATPPVVTCTPPTGWVYDGTVPCQASDAGSGLADPADASFSLSVLAEDGFESATANTETHPVCDVVGNSAIAGPVTVMVDRAPPVVTCPAAPDGWSATDVVLTCTGTDGGSGLPTPTAQVSTAVPAGVETDNAEFLPVPPMCDALGNCAEVPLPGPAQVDHLGPAATCDAPPEAWQPGEVAVRCEGSDAGSGMAPGAESVDLVTTVGDGNVSDNASTNTGNLCDAVGNCTPVGPLGGIRIDRALPTVGCDAPTGWQAGTSVVVNCSAADAGSGVAGAPTQQITATVEPGTEAQVFPDPAPVCDVAGGCVDPAPVSVLIDDAPPTVACAATPDQWFPATAEVGCTAADGGSGLADADKAFVLQATIPEGTANAAVPFPARDVCDLVGHCTPVPPPTPARIDRALPVLSCETPPTGVQAMEVDLACTATDEGSGLADPADAVFHLRTSVGAGNTDLEAKTSSRHVCDVTGGCSDAGPYTVAVDRTLPPPAPPPHIVAPARIAVIVAADTATPGVPYTLPAVSDGAGLIQLTCVAPPGSVFAEGLSTVACRAEDDAGQIDDVTLEIALTRDRGAAAVEPAPAGSAFAARAIGARAGAPVVAELDGVAIAEGAADGDGDVFLAVAIPDALPAGEHVLVLRTTSAGGAPYLVLTPFVSAAEGSGAAGNGVPTVPPPDIAVDEPPGSTTTTSLPVTTTTSVPPSSTTTTDDDGSGTAAPTADSDGGGGSGLAWAAAGVALLAAIAGIVLFVRRRRVA